MAPERDAGQPVRQAAPDRAAHRGEGSVGVAAPLGRVALAAEERRAGPDHAVPVHLAGHLGDRVVEQQRVDVVQLGAGHAVRRHRVGRDALGEVGLEDRDALPEQRAQQALEPLDGRGAGEVDDAAGRVRAVPGVRDVHLTILIFQEVSVRRGLGEDRAEVRDVRVHPQTGLEALLLERGQHPLGVGKALRVPPEVRPVPLDLPVAVQVQDVAGDAPLADPPRPRQHPLLGVLEEARGDPAPEGPLGRQRRGPREQVVPRQDLGDARPADHVVVDQVVRHDDLDAAVRRAADVELHRHAAVHQETVTPAGHIERNILIRTIRLSAERVKVPHQRALAALVERGELLAEPAEVLVGLGGQALLVGHGHAAGQGTPERQRAQPAADVHVAGVLLGQQAALRVGEAQVPGIEGDLRPYGARVHDDPGLAGLHPRARERPRAHHLDDPRGAGAGLRVLAQPHADHPLPRDRHLDDEHLLRRGRGLEGRAPPVRGRQLGPGERGKALLSPHAHRELRRVRAEVLVRDQRGTVRHRCAPVRHEGRTRELVCRLYEQTSTPSRPR